jgi:hypothetical protein
VERTRTRASKIVVASESVKDSTYVEFPVASTGDRACSPGLTSNRDRADGVEGGNLNPT